MFLWSAGYIILRRVGFFLHLEIKTISVSIFVFSSGCCETRPFQKCWRFFLVLLLLVWHFRLSAEQPLFLLPQLQLQLSLLKYTFQLSKNLLKERLKKLFEKSLKELLKKRLLKFLKKWLENLIKRFKKSLLQSFQILQLS
ncbi:hypothetical protein BGZ98_008176 [Dissophora globulifera]|nr:hypothetical protein BGZ98_008176 [Dissophora globulifera]